MKSNILFNIIGLLLAISIFTACEKDAPFIPNEEELITNFTYTLTANGVDPVTMNFTDLDGEGGNAPTITGGTLVANTTYTGTLDLLNEAATPTESITEEITEEAEEHQFFYAVTGLDLTVAYADTDANNQPLGLATTLTTGAASTGNLTITLRHEPNKSATGVEAGQLESAGGETDIEVTFPVTIR